MNVLVVGLGSMGKRRIRLLKSFRQDILIAGVDSSASRRDEVSSLFEVETFESIENAIKCFNPNIGLICTPPLTHGDITTTLLNANLHIFSEINLVSYGYNENIKLAKDKDLVLFLSSTPMYRKEIEYITGEVKNREKLRYSYHVGQYLPDWHPWEKYTDFFVGNKLTNGCRELFAIELPWIINAFGEISSFTSHSDKLTDLCIDYPDCYSVTLVHKNGTIGQLFIDVICRKAVRDLEVFGNDFFLRWGGTPSSLMNFCILTKQELNIECYDEVINDSRYADNIIENAYVAEIEAFFEEIENRNNKARHCFESDKKVLSLIDNIEKG